ncbi:MAG: hypothetical protein EHM49_00730 [Deltaproteobacteria bacterium]|nr:MAG: hypothetical protein EHM49_00730 [Deltaproteobacteria bacterium]
MRDVIGQNKTCLEQKCTIEFQGKTFESGGAFIGINRKTGKRDGIVYAYQGEGKVGNWHGDIKVPAVFGREWTSSFGDIRQSISFTWKEMRFSGIYFKSGSDIVRVREIKH